AARLSHDGRWLVLTYSTVARSNDVWLVDFAAYRRDGSVERREVSRGTAGTATGTVKGDTLYLFTFKGAPNGRVIAVDTAAPDESNWRDLIPERSDAAIASVTFTEGHIVVNYLLAASNTLEAFDLQGRATGVVPLPSIGSATTASNEGSDEAYFEFASF